MKQSLLSAVSAALLAGAAGEASAQQIQETGAVRFGLDARLRYEVYDPTSFGRGPQDDNGYGLWRILPDLEWTPAPHWKIYLQGFAGDVIDRNGGARANDRNDLDVTQAYLEWRPRPRSFVRFGRQEIALGSGRLLAANDGANVRRQFDGVYGSHAIGDVSLVGVASGLVRVNPGAFDDVASLDRAMVGGGLVHTPDETTINAIYAIHAKRPEAIFGSPAAPQERFAIGARMVRRWESADLEIEAIAQGGEADGLDVRAWAMAGDTGYRLAFAGGSSLRFWLKASAASGDSDPNDQRLGGFDPLFSNPNYAGSFPIVGPTNVLAFNPGMTFRTAGSMQIGLDVARLHRLESNDSVYAFSGLALPARDMPNDDIGALWALTVLAPLSQTMRLQATFARLEAGDYFSAADADTSVAALNLIYSR